MNLLDYPWIPTDTGRVGLTQLLEAPHRRQLALGGMGFLAVLRLLLAICSAGGETSRSLLRRKAVQTSTLRALERHREAFELEGGCWTCSDLSGRVSPLQRLNAAMPTGHNRVFQMHARDDQPAARAPELVALDLLTYQLAALDFGRSSTGPRHHSPCATAALGVAVGANLLETLALNLVPEPGAPRPGWCRPQVRCDDLRAQSRPTASSISERYTWVAQAVRFAGGGVITARGFKLDPLGDPMTAICHARDGQVFAAKALRSSAWLTGCRLCGFGATPASTLEHARRLGMPHAVRVVAQVNNPATPSVLVETIDGTFERELLESSSAERVDNVCGRLERRGQRDAARVFLSYLEDALLEGDPAELQNILGRALEDAGSAALKRQAATWLGTDGAR